MWVGSSDGTDAEQLTEDPVDGYPRWSPDDAEIGFVTDYLPNPSRIEAIDPIRHARRVLVTLGTVWMSNLAPSRFAWPRADRLLVPALVRQGGTNGGLLYATAMMAAGWDTGTNSVPQRNAPGFPDNGQWNVKWENLKPAP